MKSIFCFQESTETIRTIPENYLVAHRHGGRWICEPDAAVPYKMALVVFKAIHTNHSLRYGSGLSLLAAITPNYKTLWGAI